MTSFSFPNCKEELGLCHVLLFVVCIWRHQKQDHANYDQFAPNFGIVHKTIQHVSVPNLNLLGPKKPELWAKEVGEFSVMLYGKMSCRHSFVYQHGCRNINVSKFSKLWTAVTLAFFGISTWNLQRPVKAGLFILCKNFVKKSLIKVFDDVIANREYTVR